MILAVRWPGRLSKLFTDVPIPRVGEQVTIEEAGREYLLSVTSINHEPARNTVTAIVEEPNWPHNHND